jgi:hypothetical protein
MSGYRLELVGSGSFRREISVLSTHSVFVDLKSSIYLCIVQFCAVLCRIVVPNVGFDEINGEVERWPTAGKVAGMHTAGDWSTVATKER